MLAANPRPAELSLVGTAVTDQQSLKTVTSSRWKAGRVSGVPVTSPTAAPSVPAVDLFLTGLAAFLRPSRGAVGK